MRRWKEAARARGPEESEQDKTAALLFGKPGLNNGSGSGSNSSGSNGSGDRSGRGKGSGGGGDVKRTPAEEKQRTIEEGFRCRDWYSLYQVSVYVRTLLFHLLDSVWFAFAQGVRYEG